MTTFERRSQTSLTVCFCPGADGGLQYRIPSSRQSFGARGLLSTGEPSVAQDHSAGAPGDLRCHQGPERTGRTGDHHTVSRALTSSTDSYRQSKMIV